MAEINIEIHQDRVVFTCKQYHMTLKPVVYLRLERNKEIVEAVGSEINEGNNIVKFDLFSSATRDGNISRKMVLDIFFRYGIQEIIKKLSFMSVFIRPKVQVLKLENLNDLLHGYQHFLIKDSLERGGARQVTFDPPVSYS